MEISKEEKDFLVNEINEQTKGKPVFYLRYGTIFSLRVRRIEGGMPYKH